MMKYSVTITESRFITMKSYCINFTSRIIPYTGCTYTKNLLVYFDWIFRTCIRQNSTIEIITL